MDIPALQEELTSLAGRWQELDETLTKKLVEFQNWMQTNFPKPDTAGFYDPHIPFHMYPAAQAHCSTASLDLELLYDSESLIFMTTDQQGDSYTIRLPFAWLSDPDAFRTTVQAEVDAEQARLHAKRPAREAKLKALSEARQLVWELERGLQSDA